MFPEPTDTFGVLNHMFFTSPLDKELQEKLREKKLSLYSYTRNPMNICSRKKELMVSVMRKCNLIYKVFDVHHVIYPQMNISIHKSTLLKNANIEFSREKSPHKCYLLASNKWTYNYYHFLTEALPSVLFMNKDRYHYPIIIDNSKFAKSVFRWFGVDNEIIMADKDGLIDIDLNCALFQQEYIECGNPSPEKIEILREYVESHVEFQPSIGVLIYRKESTRSIVNHDEVLEGLRKLTPDMEWHVFNEATIADTVDLFSRAKVIVAPHGAGLTNMIFSKKGIKIIEFMPIEHPNICYWHLSEVVGHQYNMIPVNEVDGGKLSVDMGEVQPILSELLADVQ